MKAVKLFFFLLIGAAVSFATAVYVTQHPASNGLIATHQTSYERVVKTQTLRCGYQYWAGAIERDEKTGQLAGPWVDIMNAIGDASGLKIVWGEQVGWDEVSAALKSGKVDAMCAGMWTSADKAKEIAFTTPLAYQAIQAYVRTDDHRFDDGLGSINNENTKVVVIDNDNSDFIARQDYPRAQRVSLGTLNGTDSDLMMNVMTGKADVTFTVAGLWRQFDKGNPGKIRPLTADKLRVFGLANAVDNDDWRLLNMLNAAQQEIENSGRLDKILDQANRDYPDMYIKPLKAFP